MALFHSSQAFRRRRQKPPGTGAPSMTGRSDRIETPLLPARSIPRRDGSRTYEVWCEWCEAFHHHYHIVGDLPAHCDQAGHSPYLKTGYRAKVIVQDLEPFGGGAFPSGAAVGSALGVRKFSSSIRFTVSPIRRGFLRSLFLIRGEVSFFRRRSKILGFRSMKRIGTPSTTPEIIPREIIC
jgi:hypothetical protein